MKLILGLLMLTTASYANVADVNCTMSQPISVQGNFGTVQFRRASLDFTYVTQDNSNSAVLVMQDQFGPGFEVFNRLWDENSRCRNNSTCLMTDFSRLNGLSFEFPNTIFAANNTSFTMRVRDNRSFRTYFAQCKSNLR